MLRLGSLHFRRRRQHPGAGSAPAAFGGLKGTIRLEGVGFKYPSRPRWAVQDLDVEIRQDRVILHGRTTTYHVKQLAQHGVRECLPEVVLENEIVVCQ